MYRIVKLLLVVAVMFGGVAFAKVVSSNNSTCQAEEASRLQEKFRLLGYQEDFVRKIVDVYCAEMLSIKIISISSDSSTCQTMESRLQEAINGCWNDVNMNTGDDVGRRHRDKCQMMAEYAGKMGTSCNSRVNECPTRKVLWYLSETPGGWIYHIKCSRH